MQGAIQVLWLLYGITQCYLSPGSGDLPAFTPAEAGTCEGMQGWVAACAVVTDRPSEPGQPAVTSITRRSVVLSWYGCSYDGGCTVTGYRIELQLLQAGSLSHDDDDDDDDNWQLVTDSCQVCWVYICITTLLLLLLLLTYLLTYLLLCEMIFIPTINRSRKTCWISFRMVSHFVLALNYLNHQMTALWL